VKERKMSVFHSLTLDFIKNTNFVYAKQFENLFKKRPTPYHNSFLALKTQNFKLGE